MKKCLRLIWRLSVQSKDTITLNSIIIVFASKLKEKIKKKGLLQNCGSRTYLWPYNTNLEKLIEQIIQMHEYMKWASTVISIIWWFINNCYDRRKVNTEQNVESVISFSRIAICSLITTAWLRALLTTSQSNLQCLHR